MRALVVLSAFVVVVVVAGAGCISSPSVSLVEPPDASALAIDAPDGSDASPAPSTTTSTTSEPPPPPPPKLCDGRCAAAGGTCANDACTFTCPGSPRCKEDIVCPPGMPCVVTCTGKEACAGEVKCLDATSCTIACDGDDACKGHVSCAGPVCAVTCANKGCSSGDVRCCATTCTLNGAPLTCP